MKTPKNGDPPGKTARRAKAAPEADREETVQADLVAAIINDQTKQEEAVDPEFLNDFLTETGEHLETIALNVLALEAEPANLDLVHALFREFHTIKGLAGFVNQDLIREIAHRTETLLDGCRKSKITIGKELIDLLLRSIDNIKQICADLGLNRDSRFAAAVAGHLEGLERQVGRENAEERGPTGTGDFEEAESPGRDKAEAPERRATGVRNAEGGHVRVPNQKVDSLGDLTGELLIVQSQIEAEIARRFGANDTLMTSLGRMEKIAKNIQGLSMSLRMVSLRSTFLKISRISRDTAISMGKDVHLQIIGEETEIDRRVADSIFDPLLHLINNSIYHGIESESHRISLGKPAQGLVKIQAYSRRGSVYIEVTDDGQGIQLDRIREKAQEKKLLDSAKTYDDEEILNLIFLPGFSTVKSADNISGRGVGLDVVKTEVSKIGGRVEVRNRPGEGCSFLLKVPINLAAINGTIIEVAESTYIIPTLFIRQIIHLDPSQWLTIAGSKALIRINDQVVPVLPLARFLGLEEGDRAESDLLVVVELEHRLAALPVTRIVDRREVVVKTLGSDLSHLDYVAGASILGDGRVSLIIDVESIFGIGEVM